jgi:hypothetical protein
VGLDLKVTGADDLHALYRRFNEASRTDLVRQLNRGLRESADDVADAITEHSDTYMPQGYEVIFRSSLHYKTQVRTAYETRISLIVKAVGAKGNDRQVEQLERGELRAPNWGRHRARRGINRGRHKLRNPWHVQRIRAHFATEPAEDAIPQVWKRIDAAAARVAKKIEGVA